MNPETAMNNFDTGNQLLQEGKLEEAIAAYRHAIELNPDLSWCHHNLGEALAKFGQFEEAIAAFRRAIELNPDFSWSYHHLGDVLDRQQQWEEAVVAFRRAIELNPEHFGSYCGLGQSLVKLGRLDEAIAAYRRASELEPAADWIQYRLGEVLQQRVQVDIEGAIAADQKAVELNPSSETFRQNLEKVLAEDGNFPMKNMSSYATSDQSSEINPDRKYKVYDCFAFFNELDILKIRIEELKDVVDKFILVEATKTFSGNPKPLYYQEFIHEFAEYQDKIIHYVVDDMPEIDYSQPVHLQAWPLDVHQKNCIAKVLKSIDCKDEDIILVNDCDEIPRKEKITEAIELLKDNEFVIFVQDLYHCNIESLASEWWCGTVACKYKDFKVRNYTKVRYSDKINTGLEIGDPAYKRSGYINSNQYFEHPYIFKSGWSFSWFGSELSRRYKLQSFAHKEGDDSQAKGIEKIKYDVCRPTLEIESSGEFYFDIRDIEGKDVPEFLRKNIFKYRHFLQPRQTALMAKLGGEFKQADIHLETLKNEISKVKNQLEKRMQNLLKVCDSLAEKGELVEAIAQWRQLVELYPEFTSKKCFLSNLDGIKDWRINPEDYTLISRQLIPTQTGNQLVSQTGNYGQLCYGPYISLPDGLYRVKINLENTDFSVSKCNDHEPVLFKFDVAVNKGLVIYEETVYTNHQTQHEFFIDFVNAQDLEIRFWAKGLSFAVNFIELTLIYPPGNNKAGADYLRKIQVEPMLVELEKTISQQQKIAIWKNINTELQNIKDIEWAIYQWRKALEISPEFNQESCFLSNLEGINTWHIAPEQINLISGQLIASPKGQSVVSIYGNYAEVGYGPYLSLPVGLYRIKIDFNWLEDDPQLANQNTKEVGFQLELMINKGWVVYKLDICRFQKSLELFIDLLNAQDFALRYWAKGIGFAINFVDISLLVEHSNDDVSYYIDLGKHLQKKGETGAACAYKKAAELNLERYLAETIANNQQHLNCVDIYDKIWQSFNQLTVLDEQQLDYPTKINQDKAYKYFSQTNYRVMCLDLLTQPDIEYLEAIGVNLGNVTVNKQDNFEWEQLYIKSFKESSHDLLGKLILQPECHQQSLVETGYMYAVCPFSGKIVRSNQSFVINHGEHPVKQRGHDLQGFVYRFVGQEVFYLMTGAVHGGKILLYFPQKELIINFQLHLRQCSTPVDNVKILKSYMVSSWQKVRNYISTPTKQLIDVIGLGFNMGHYIWQDLVGLDVLREHGILHKLDKVLTGPGDYFSSKDIFPEIPADKFIEVEDVSDVFEKVIENNYVALRVNGIFIKEQLIERIRQTALQKCSIDFLTHLKQVRQHEPLLGVHIRTTKRIWVGMVEGIANIIKKLHSNYPNLGIVFSGWSVTGKEDENNECWSIIDMEKEKMEEIKALIPQTISTYSAIGSTIEKTVVWANAIDAHISQIGSELTFLSWIANKPGVVHGPTVVYLAQTLYASSTHRENLIPQVFLSKNYIVDKEGGLYDCDWQAIYDEIFKIVNQLNPS